MNSPASLIVRIVALAIVYFVVGRIGLMLAIPPGYATIIWPPSGIALGALIVWDSAVWPGVAIGSFVLNVAASAGTHSLASLSPSTWAVAAAITGGSTLQAILIRTVLRRIFGSPLSLDGWRDVLRLLLIAGPLGCVIASTVGSIATWLAQGSDQILFVHNWLTWWVGDAL